MSLKQEIETWVTAVAHYDNNEFQEALNAFAHIADTSKILFNCGVIHATLGEHERAVSFYQQAVQRDMYFAVAYYQQGVSNFLLGDFEEALANFNDTLLYLRGNNFIDYEQLGLKFKLHSCEALFNRGLCYIYLQQNDLGMQDLTFAAKEKATPEHDVIDEAIAEKAEGYLVFSIPVGVVFRPSEAKVRNVQTRNYLGKARLVAEAGQGQNPNHKRNVSMDNWAKDDRPKENISYAATNLVRTNLSSRTRQQSEPPIHRNVFPPTPPPEAERHASIRTTQSAAATGAVSALPPPAVPAAQEPRPPTVRSRSASRTRKPARLELGIAAFEQPRDDRPRLGTRRTASEGPSRHTTRDTRGDTLSPEAGYRPPRLDSRTRHASRERGGDRDRPERREHLFGAVDNILPPPPSSELNTLSPDRHQPQIQPHDLPHRPSPSRQPSNTASRSNYSRHDTIAEGEEPLSPTPHGHSRIPPSAASSTFSGTLESPPAARQATHRRPSQVQRWPSNSISVPTSAISTTSAKSFSTNTTPTATGAHLYPTRSAASTIPTMRKVRIKAHVADDTRYLMVSPSVKFAEFMEQLRTKLGIPGQYKIKTPDEDGDMITMGDHDDLEMVLQTARDNAKRDGVDMGKIEVWIEVV